MSRAKGIRVSYGGSRQDPSEMPVGEEFIAGRRKSELWGWLFSEDSGTFSQSILSTNPRKVDRVFHVHLYVTRNNNGLYVARLGMHPVVLAFSHDEDRNNPYGTLKL
jgi:hypothetical protein